MEGLMDWFVQSWFASAVAVCLQWMGNWWNINIQASTEYTCNYTNCPIWNWYLHIQYCKWMRAIVFNSRTWVGLPRHIYSSLHLNTTDVHTHTHTHIYIYIYIYIYIIYRGADKSWARPGRKQATATEDFDFHITYL